MILVSKKSPINLYRNNYDLVYRYSIIDDKWILEKETKIGTLLPTQLTEEQGLIFYLKHRLTHIFLYDDKDELLTARAKLENLILRNNIKTIEIADEFLKDFVSKYK